MRLAAFLLLGFFLPVSVWSADTLMNMPPRQDGQSTAIVRQFAPGATVVLPNGRTTIIKSRLENGYLLTEDGLILSREGIIIEGPDQGAFVIPAGRNGSLARMEEKTAPEIDAARLLPQEELVLGRPGNQTNAEIALSPDTAADEDKPAANQERKEMPAPRQEEAAGALPDKGAPKTAAAAQGAAGKNSPEDMDELFTLAELLPMTRVPAPADGARPETAAKANPPAKAKEDNQKREQARPVPAAAQKTAHKEQPAKAPEKKEPRHQEARAPEKKEPRHQEAKKAPGKPSPGDELRIPPEAAKTGNLAFLEGCWQGTRPEYYSKRTIRECFCFGANGQNGKRRVIDPLGRRRCIGSASAHLSQSGVLSVKSSGAACNDGERWGQAEMVCRNSGPRTPCSWVFADAQNGRQSYEIPFIRVESCGR